MKNIILIVILLIIIFGASAYIYNSKKKGKGCIGCQHADHCKERACACNHEDK